MREYANDVQQRKVKEKENEMEQQSLESCA